MATGRTSDALLVSRAAVAGDEELSKDLAQDTFVKAWLNIGSFRAAAGFATWLYRIACNTFYDRLRSHRPAAREEEALDMPVEPHAIDAGFDLGRALLTLKAEDRAAMLLYYMEDRISRIMDIPGGTVKSHPVRGRGKLSKYLSGYEKQ